MNPSNFQKSEVGSTSKSAKHAYIQPGALGRGRGISLRTLGSVRVTAEQSYVGNSNAASILNELAQKNRLPPSFNPMQGSVPSRQEVEVTAEQSYVGNSNAVSILNELAQKNRLPPSFNPMQGGVPSRQEVEVTQAAQRGLCNSGMAKKVKGTNICRDVAKQKQGVTIRNELPLKNSYMPPSFNQMQCDVSPDQEEVEVTQAGLRDSEKAKKMRVNDIYRDVARQKHGETIRNKLLSLKNSYVPPGFNSMQGGVPSTQEVEVTQAAQRGLCNSGMAKKVKGNNICRDVAKQKQGVRNELPLKNSYVPPNFNQMQGDVSPDQEVEVTQASQRSLPDSAKAKKVRGNDIYRDIARQKQGKTIQNDLSLKNSYVPPSFGQMPGDVPPPQEAEVMQDAQRSEISPSEPKKARKVRGPNRVKDVAKLKPGEKLPVLFYHNGTVGKYQTAFSRHLGVIVRNPNMCPVRVHSWSEIEEYKLEHMWEAVIEKFESPDMNANREHVIRHMRKLWTNWRGSLHKDMKLKPLNEVLKAVPEGMDKRDWEWLVKEHFLSEEFKEASARNAVNRSKLTMPHRTGSMPIREVIYEMGGKDGITPNIADVFFETRKKDGKLVEPETNAKYAEIQQLVQSEPSLTNIEVVERCFGPQCKSHVVGFGGGITAKELKGGNSSRRALLDELKASRMEKESLQERVAALERRSERLESIILAQQPSSSMSSSEQ